MENYVSFKTLLVLCVEMHACPYVISEQFQRDYSLYSTPLEGT